MKIRGGSDKVYYATQASSGRFRGAVLRHIFRIMAMKITEDWIKERVKLESEKLEDVKTLALPGNYHEKIAGVSTSLSNFSRLQELDLSRNAICSLDGLSHLKHLEVLNLYYNQVPDLKEVFKLRRNQSLKSLDLRLNPVTKTEPDYRLFVVHMLPHLRTFDDRSVRENERKAALMHFSNEQAADMDIHKRDKYVERELEEARTSSQPRAEYVKNLVKKPTYVTDEDTCLDVIDLMNRNGGDVRNPRQPTGGIRTDSEVEDHTHSDLLRLAQKENPTKFRQNHHEDMNGHAVETKEHHPAGPSKKTAPIRNEYEDQEVYSKYKSVANYTRHPGSMAPPPTAAAMREPSVRSSSEHSEFSIATENEYPSLPNVKRLNFEDSNGSAENPGRGSAQTRFLEEFLDLVDKYWNGSKSLHYHKKFKSLIEKPLVQFEEDVASSKEIQIRALQDKISTLTTENKNLHIKMHSISKQKSTLSHSDFSQKEQEAMRSRLQLSISDNKILRKKIAEMEEKLQVRSGEKARHDNGQLIELEKQKRSLAQQVANLSFQLKNYESLDDLTKMLQESHKSLISTNDRLLSELDETRSRHQSEVEQLKWSYDQLRKTSDLLGSTINDDTSQTNGY